MGVVKTASESVLEEVVVPSEEANYSVQGHAGKFLRTLFYLFIFLSFSFLSILREANATQGGWRQKGKRPRVRHSWLGSGTRNVGRRL